MSNIDTKLQKKKASKDTDKWSDEAVCALINSIRDLPCLWDKKNPEFHLLDKNRDARELVQAELQIHGFTKTIEEIKDKWANTRYRRKVKEFQLATKPRSGAGANDPPSSTVPKPTDWKFAADMAFLDESLELREQLSNLDPQLPETPRAKKRPSSNSSSRQHSPFDDGAEEMRTFITTVADKISNKSNDMDEDESFGIHIGRELKTMEDSDEKDEAKVAITNVVMECKRKLRQRKRQTELNN